MSFVESRAAREGFERLTAGEDEMGAKTVVGVEVSWDCCWSFTRR